MEDLEVFSKYGFWALLYLALKSFIDHESTKLLYSSIVEHLQSLIKGKTEKQMFREQANIINETIEYLTHSLDCLYTTVSLYHNGTKIGVYQKYSIIYETNNFWNEAKRVPPIMRDYQGCMLSPYFKMIEKMDREGFVIYSSDTDKKNLHARKTLSELSAIGADSIMFVAIRKEGEIIACMSVISDNVKTLEDNKVKILNAADRVSECIAKSNLITQI